MSNVPPVPSNADRSLPTTSSCMSLLSPLGNDVGAGTNLVLQGTHDDARSSRSNGNVVGIERTQVVEPDRSVASTSFAQSCTTMRRINTSACHVPMAEPDAPHAYMDWDETDQLDWDDESDQLEATSRDLPGSERPKPPAEQVLRPVCSPIQPRTSTTRPCPPMHSSPKFGTSPHPHFLDACDLLKFQRLTVLMHS